MQRVHFAYLDGCRALAIAGVGLTHSIWLVHRCAAVAGQLAHFGSKGVELFFVVSGMTLAQNYDAKTFDAREFFIRRFFRIAPMYCMAAPAYAGLGATYRLFPLFLLLRKRSTQRLGRPQLTHG